jgi:hypothetical protein
VPAEIKIMNIRNAVLILFIFFAKPVPLAAQVYFTKNGSVSFFSKTILENIAATNNEAIGILNIQTGEMQFSLLNNGFHFPKAKMEEDFNEDYMESAHYPRSTFKGIVSNINKIDFSNDGTWPVMVNGDLQMHGITKKISVPGKIIITNGKINATATFSVWLKDYDIKIPSIVSNKISEKISISVNCLYQKK